MLKTCSSSTGETLTTLANFKLALNGVTTATSTGEDDFMTQLITRATKTVERYIGYPLRHASYSETLPAWDSNRLMVSRTPIQSVAAISHLPEMSSVTTTSWYVENPEAGIIHRDLGWYWSAGVAYDLEAHIIPNSELRVFQVDYDAGFVLAGSTTTYETVPDDLEEAILDTAVAFYRSVGQDPTMQSQKIGDLSITYARGQSGNALTVTPKAEALLQRWRRII
jgi:hypothetical protein